MLLDKLNRNLGMPHPNGSSFVFSGEEGPDQNLSDVSAGSCTYLYTAPSGRGFEHCAFIAG